MRNLFEGGQCNPNAIGSSNQFKGMLNQMQMGAKNAEKIMDHSQQGHNLEGNIQAREMMFGQMGQNWKLSEAEIMAQQKEKQKMLGRQFNEAELEHHRRNMQMMQIQEMEMRKAEEMMMMKEREMIDHFNQMQLQQNAKMMENQFMMEKEHDKAQHIQMDKKAQQESIMNSSQSMLEVMMNDPDPRFQNSEFLHFLKRIQNKELIIEGKQIRQVKPDEQMMEKNWEGAEKQYEQNLKTMETGHKLAEEKFQENMKTMEMQHQTAEEKYNENWQKRLEDFEKEYEDHENFEKMLEDKYMEVLKEMNLDLTEAWQGATDLEEELVHGEIRQTYIFSENNPFLNQPMPKFLALNFINSAKNNEAILALEAHLQKNMEDSDSWRILGRILQQNDQDQKSITCFMNSIKYNPENLDSLLSLGVSCTNILDEVKAMNFLKKWIILNPKYKHLGIDPNIIPDNEVDYNTYKIEDIKMMNEKIIHVFENAAAQYQNDPELYNALAILYFVKRDYERSIDLFKNALHFDPTNYLLMNKIGAALAHLGRADEALEYYHKALDIRPNYVRVWVNVGIAHGFKGDYEEAARFYLNSLSFRPDAKHVWSYLHTTFMNMQRYDLINKISTQDPQSFSEFEVINLNELPEPAIEYKLTTEKHILNREASQWLSEIKK